MRFSQFYAHPKRDVAKQDSVNAYLLQKAGYVSQVAAGVYAFLPLATRTMHKIEQIIREEMDKIGGSEVIFSALQPRQIWEKSARWEDPNFKQIVYYDREVEMTFAPTHEEPMTSAVKETVQSYRDLPVILYQFQTKFRKELRPKSGLLRGREFRMKDLYSFHRDEKSHHKFYEQTAKAYLNVFKRLGLDAYRVKAVGGVFSSSYSDEFQIICPTGEDTILVDHETKTGFNKEIEKELSQEQRQKLEEVKAIEVGNIFHLGTKYSEAFDLRYLDQDGQRQSVVMGSYGIGISRLLGTLAETFNDENGLILPRAASPFDIHLIDLADEGRVGAEMYQQLTKQGYEVLYDDREVAAGVKLVEADLIGVPLRLLHSPKTAQEGKIELKTRADNQVQLVAKEELYGRISKIFGSKAA